MPPYDEGNHFNNHYQHQHMSSTPNSSYLLNTCAADGTGLGGLSGCDPTWVFEADTDLAQMQMQFSDFGSTDIGIPDVPGFQSLHGGEGRLHSGGHSDFVACHDLSAGYQMSNGSSLSMPSSRSRSASSLSAMLLPSYSSSPSSSSSSSPSPPFPVAAEIKPHDAGQVQQVSQCRSQRHRSEKCITAALHALTTLHIAQSACLSAHQETPTVQQARKMETVLSANKDTIARMGSILACSCSTKSPVQLLLLSICGNLIAWSDAMISADPDQGDDPFSSACALPAGSPAHTPKVRVLPQPITIGQHQIGGKLGRALHAQVMAGELRVLEGLVDALSRRFCQASGSDGASGTTPPTHMRNVGGRAAVSPSLQSKGLSNNVHRHIVSLLRTRLENTRARIFSRG